MSDIIDGYLITNALGKGIRISKFKRHNPPLEYLWHEIGKPNTSYLDCEVFVTRDAAVAAAENMRRKKILSLKKSLKRLESLSFD